MDGHTWSGDEPEMREDGFLTVAEAAKRLGMGRQFIYDACARMGLKHTRMGRHIRIHSSWLDAWVEARVLTVA